MSGEHGAGGDEVVPSGRGFIVHRINTYPLVHLGWLHLLLNLAAWVPLAERFEHEVGSAKMGGLLLGRELFSSL